MAGFFDLSSFNDPEVIGLFLSVGTIRTLVIYAWTKHISHLWMADIDERIVQFNRSHFGRLIFYIAFLGPISDQVVVTTP